MIVNNGRQFLLRTRIISACTASRLASAAETALDAKVKALLQSVADREDRMWRQSEPTVDDPGAGLATCAPQCGLCASGWVGQISCVKNASGPSYQHNETQRWYVGGATSNPTLFTYAWTTTGSGGNSMQTWTVSGTGAGQLEVLSSAQGLTFQRYTSQLRVHNGVQGSSSSSEAFEYLWQPFTGSSGATQVMGSRTYSGQSCDEPQAPGNTTCTVVCSWNMALQ
jgi:hypothetical protein